MTLIFDRHRERAPDFGIVNSAAKELASMSRARVAFSFLLAVAVCTLCTSSYAAAIVAGQTIAAPGEADPTGGVVQAGTGIAVPFASPPGPGSFSGTLTTKVIAGDPSNALGGLTFTYQLTNDANSLAALERLTNINFTGFLTDVSYQTPVVAGVIPTSVDRDASGTTMGWSFSALGAGAIPPNGSSAILVIQTNALNFAPINANVIDGSVGIAASFGPVAIPEPAALALLGIGMLSAGIFGRGRRRR
jgi:hypothetical protein